MLSMSDSKRRKKHSIQNRTTKTKASATKPEVFGISLLRNKNNPNPALFNSVKKKKSEILVKKPRSFQQQSERKQSNPTKLGPTLYEDLNTKISIDYMNFLNSDLLVKFGYELRSQLENKENIISERNLSITLPSKQQRECFNKIKELVELKDQVNKSYACMKNSEVLFDYLANQYKSEESQVQIRKTHNINYVHQQIGSFLKIFKHKQHQLENLQKQYEKLVKDKPKDQTVERQSVEEENLDAIIESLKQQIAQQKKLCLRYEKEEKFLISKLYFTQKKNNDLRSSSANLKIKNTNLKDTIRLARSNSTIQLSNSPKLHRSFSVKLQRIKKYNLEDDPLLINQTQPQQKSLIKSKSHSSLNSVQKTLFVLNSNKQTFLHQIC